MNNLFTLLAQGGTDMAADGGGIATQSIAAPVFSVLGLVVLTLAFVLLSKLTPLPLPQPIRKDQNTALGGRPPPRQNHQARRARGRRHRLPGRRLHGRHRERLGEGWLRR